ncbi:hypothetical protein OPKNFCMD_3559 [Methylobacterium crusticola]|uniref:Uncharacterized protein n=1 Tax=Methylobacterium crusticola TaxID=1697972 RepID=A0ABQ4QZH3_9HYPH|nr:hypothetical protein OPKNFCMD_3559 [Methylobacterium crusticola]
MRGGPMRLDLRERTVMLREAFLGVLVVRLLRDGRRRRGAGRVE